MDDKRYKKIVKYLALIRENRFQKISTYETVEFCPCGYKTGHTPPPLSEFSTFTVGESFGTGGDSHAWFHLTANTQEDGVYLRVFSEYTGRNTVTPQFIAYLNGHMTQGMDTNHTEVLLPKGASDIYIYAYTAPEIEKAKFFAEIVKENEDVNGLYYDILYPFEMLSFYHVESTEYSQIINALYEAVSLLNLYEIGSAEFTESVKEARAFLSKNFYKQYCKEQPTSTVCIGHTHIDCAWLWTLEQTREKVQRSFATVLEYMKRFREYKFMSSQALLYKFFKEESPELYNEIKARVKENRWEVEGAMWVEADCNLSSGESLIRQIVYGKRFFKEEFGKDCKVLWLPDVFGYSAALPQILKKTGIDWFVTSKISWNEINRMPYDTFLWEGIDGSRVKSYFLTAQEDNGKETFTYGDYVASTNAPWISGAYKRYSQKHLSDEALLTYGWGDGGGGPTLDHIELLRRGEKGFSGMPNAKSGFAGAFLERLGERLQGRKDIPVWQGELYLEFHRGTYTSMADNKKCNRQCEYAYQNAETLSVLSNMLFNTKYPTQELHDGWETILTNQFHDIIPGSSIFPVYEQSKKDYSRIKVCADGIIGEAEKRLANAIAQDEGFVVVNPNAFGGTFFADLDGRTVRFDNVQPKGYTVCKTYYDKNNVQINGNTVETDIFTIVFDEHWQIVSIFDKQADREVIRKGEVGNELRLYVDYPDNYDAWEWQEYSRDSYLSITDIISCEVVDAGAKKGLWIQRKFFNSTILQKIWFYDAERRVDFETEVDWHEQHKMLKTAFPVEINTNKATFDIQYGSIERPTHFNTSWDRARFETCAHKYADLSDSGYGISLLNDCKYGYDVHDGVMQLSLLRGPTNPNPIADQGKHFFTYSICPHFGNAAGSDVLKQAYALNNPIKVIKAMGESTYVPLAYSLVLCNQDNVLCEVIKQAEDGDDIIVRLYESKNMRKKTNITFGFSMKQVFVCDMLENELYELPVDGNTVEYDMCGFEILTLKVKN